MRKKTVYLLAVLTLLTVGLTLVPSAHSQTQNSQAQNIKVVDYGYYIDSEGYLDVVGQVQNVGNNTINPIFLTGSVTSAGVDESNTETQVWVLDLIPQQIAPFYMEFQQPTATGYWAPSEVSNITFGVLNANATTSYQYPDLKIISSSGFVGTSGNYDGAYGVSGVIQNTGSQTATNLTVVGAFFNSTGAIVAVGYTDYLVPATLPPSGTAPFTIYALDLNMSQVPSSEKISKYSLLVQTEGPILQGTPPANTTTSITGSSSPSSPSTGSSSPTQTKAASSNNSAVIYAVVGVIVIVVIAGALLALLKRKPYEEVKPAAKARKKSKTSGKSKKKKQN